MLHMAVNLLKLKHIIELVQQLLTYSLRLNFVDVRTREPSFKMNCGSCQK
jgi:hypothetical protein